MKPLTRFLPNFLLVVAILLSGCSSPVPSQAPSASTQSPVASSTQPTAAPAGTAAPYFLADPSAGLTAFPGYQATLTLRFNGTQAGKSAAWSQSYTLTAMGNPQVSLLAYQETGLDPNVSAYPAFNGTAAGVLYLKNTPTSACTAAFATEPFDPTSLPQPAALLPKLHQTAALSSGNVTTIGGISAKEYSFDASAFTTIASVQAAGKLWLAAENQNVAKYSLQVEADSAFFGGDTAGTMSWEYEMHPLAAGLDSLAALLPADCPLPLPEMPVMEGAANVLRFPGYLGFETIHTLQEVADFYMTSLPGAGFKQVGEAQIGALIASLTFSKDKQGIDILAESGTTTRVTFTRHANGQNEAQAKPTPNAVPTSAGANPQMRVANAMTLLLGSEQVPSVFPSYHLAFIQKSPAWNGSQVVQSQEELTADVEGTSVHFIDKNSGMKQTSVEVYLVGDQEYEVQNGKISQGLGLNSLTWVSWPLDAVILIGIGSFHTTAAGTETLDGRPAEMYKIEGKASEDPTGMLASLNPLLKSVSGQLWVDQATGGLLKATLDYETDVKDTSGTLQGQGTGRLEILVDRVGQVTVKLPD